MQEVSNKQQQVKAAVPLKKRFPKKPEMVEGIFRNWEIRGAPITFSYTDDGSPAKKYTLEDGKKYVLPINVARHLNRCGYPTSEAEVDKQGHYLGKREGWIRRYSFRRVDDLMDDVG